MRPTATTSTLVGLLVVLPQIEAFVPQPAASSSLRLPRYDGRAHSNPPRNQRGQRMRRWAEVKRGPFALHNPTGSGGPPPSKRVRSRNGGVGGSGWYRSDQGKSPSLHLSKAGQEGSEDKEEVEVDMLEEGHEGKREEQEEEDKEGENEEEEEEEEEDSFAGVEGGAGVEVIEVNEEDLASLGLEDVQAELEGLDDLDEFEPDDNVVDGVDPDEAEGGADASEGGDGGEDFSQEEIAKYFAEPNYSPTDMLAKDGSTDELITGAAILESQPDHIHVLDNFLQPDFADALRGTFMDKFRDPREGHSERFVWDHWHVPDQYTLLRTPAEQYFGPEDFKTLVDALCDFGQASLGCRSISPPWLSCYTDGCEQRVHTDSWHGPWAFVLSLTDWDGRGFTGGQTCVYKPHTTSYWQSFQHGLGLEERHLIDKIEPHFNRLTLFDPRIPHYVEKVEGTKDPRKGRLVLHGWFTEPEPYFTGGLTADEALTPLNESMGRAVLGLQSLPRVMGVLTVKVYISGSDGSVTDVRAQSNTMVDCPNDPDQKDEGNFPLDRKEQALEVLDEELRAAEYPVSANGEDTVITVPFTFS